MICGIMVLAFPISIVALNFTDEWKLFMYDKEVAASKKRAGSMAIKLTQPELLRMIEVLHMEMKDILAVINSESKRVQDKQEELQILLNVLREKNPLVNQTDDDNEDE
jgi:hypothetical protein